MLITSAPSSTAKTIPAASVKASPTPKLSTTLMSSMSKAGATP